MAHSMTEKKILVIMTSTLMVILILEIGFNLFLAPRLRISSIMLETELNIEDPTLLSITGLDSNNWFFSVHSDEIEKSLSKLAVVHEARVEKQFPNRLNIAIDSREPLVMALVKGKGELIPLVIDREGVIFITGRDSLSYNLPLMGGLDETLREGGDRIPDNLIPLLEDLERLRVTSPELFEIISEINIMPQKRGVLDIELYLTTHSIPVLLDLPFTREKMNQAIMVVDVMEREGLAERIEEVDLRAGSVVYREREAEGV
jgi:cell division protein FtsQ